MSKRTSKRIAPLVVAALLGLSSQRAHAALDCQPTANGRHCIAGLKSENAEQFAKLQKQSEWCWAASISMIFAHYGLDIDQEEIVRAAWGKVIDMPGSPEAIAASLNRVWTDSHGRRWQVRSSAVMTDPATAAAALAADHPLIIGTVGHAMVLTAIEYDLDADGDEQVRAALVRDPWPGNGGRRPLSAQEWYGTTLLMQVEVTPLDGDGAAPAPPPPASDDAHDGGWHTS